MSLIGLFFGSFNPIHIGHTAIANYMLEFTDLERIWFVISPQNPMKQQSSLLADHHRYQMVQRAVEDFYKFKACNIEFELSRPSYTITTLTCLSDRYPEHQFALIMGSDNLETLHRWRNYEQILEQYRIFVYPRPGYKGTVFDTHKSVQMVQAPLMEISATFIREAIEQGKNVQWYLPYKAWEYLDGMRFYRK